MHNLKNYKINLKKLTNSQIEPLMVEPQPMILKFLQELNISICLLIICVKLAKENFVISRSACQLSFLDSSAMQMSYIIRWSFKKSYEWNGWQNGERFKRSTGFFLSYFLSLYLYFAAMDFSNLFLFQSRLIHNLFCSSLNFMLIFQMIFTSERVD